MQEHLPNTVYKMGATIIGIDVTFDCHRSKSIKEGKGTKRKKGHRPVRRQMENELVPLPSD